jgi:hypothetical protein
VVENETTGERINSGPRMTGEKLKERGIKTETFVLA